MISTGDQIEEAQKINELAGNLYRLHLAASMADAVEMARVTLFGSGEREAHTTTHLPDVPIAQVPLSMEFEMVDATSSKSPIVHESDELITEEQGCHPLIEKPREVQTTLHCDKEQK